MKEEISQVAIGRSIGVLVFKRLRTVDGEVVISGEMSKIMNEYFLTVLGGLVKDDGACLTPSTRGLLYCVLLQPVIFALSYNNKLKTASSIYQQA